jgi:hypothetical protein
VRRAPPIARLGILVAALALFASPSQAEQSASLRVTFTPEHLGKNTNLAFDLRIKAPPHRVPAPLIALDLRYPDELGLGASGLGLATCTRATLELIGPAGCPADSRMGDGEALAEVPFGPEILRETARVSILRAPEGNGRIALFLNVEGWHPVLTQDVLAGVLLPGPRPYETIHIDVPLVESLPEGPDVAVVQLRASLGAHGLTYYEQVHGKHVPYHPQGILLPPRCPHGGFRFTAILSFEDATKTTARTAVRCPKHAPNRRHH